MSLAYSKYSGDRAFPHLAANLLCLRRHQSEIQGSQARLEASIGQSQDLRVKTSADHALRLDGLSDRLETSQTRIEAQLQTILANQQRSRTPIMSHSLDASSPEGRQTWMELGRLLRDEGITPAMIQENRGLLVNAMKITLNNKVSLAESIPESYTTAPEYHTDYSTTSSFSQSRNASYWDVPSVLSPISLPGSAQARSAGFPNGFLERQNGVTDSLDHEQNVDDGLQSLLQGMSWEDVSREYQQLGIDYLEHEDQSEIRYNPMRHEGYQKQNGKQVEHIVEPLIPTVKPRGFTVKRSLTRKVQLRKRRR